MPYNRRYRRRRPRRRFRRKRKRVTKPKSALSLSPRFPFGRTKKVRMRYVETGLTLDPAIGASKSYFFSANGMYDPNISGIGHQPSGFDQLVGVVFTHYTVIASKITITARMDDASAETILGLYLDNDVTQHTNVERLIEQGKCKYAVLDKNADGRASIKTLTMGCNVGKFLGVGHILSESNLRGNASSNPSEQVYYNLFCAPLDANSDLAGMTFMATIDFIAVLTEPMELPSS